MDHFTIRMLKMLSPSYDLYGTIGLLLQCLNDHKNVNWLQFDYQHNTSVN